MQTFNEKIILVSLLLISLLLTGCGAKKSGGTAYSSTTGGRTTIIGSDGSTNSNGDMLGQCSMAKDSTFQAVFAAYYELNMSHNPEWIRMSIKKLPSDILSTTTHYIQIFKWSETSTGGRQYESSPTPIHFVSNTNYNDWVNPQDPITKISKNTIQKLITDFQLSKKGITLDNFFTKYHAVLTDVGLQYDAFAIGFYNSADGSSSYSMVEGLIPGFQANPKTYAATHVSTILEKLHPNYSYMYASVNYTDEQYAGFIDTNSCQKF